MANTIQLKRTSTYNSSTTPTGLTYGELAWVQGTNVMWIGKLGSDNSTVTPTNLNELVVQSYTTSTGAELNILDGATVTTAELNLLDGVTATTAELNLVDGVTSTTVELNLLDGVTATTAELNLVDGVTATTAELNILDGVTATATELNLIDGVTATTAELNLVDGVTATTAELNYVDVTSAGTAQASKAVILDASKDVTGIRNMTLTGDLTVGGSSTIVNSTTVTIADPQFELARGNTGDAMDIGIYGKYVESSTSKYSGVFRDASDGIWKVYDKLESAPSSTNGIVVTAAQENYEQGDFSAKIVASTIDCGTFA
tara:strand:- start:1150 stop:2097 length:948 start_codon:yes stop_codon:yes gene_type:complete